jgi:hypothetical protein
MLGTMHKSTNKVDTKLLYRQTDHRFKINLLDCPISPTYVGISSLSRSLLVIANSQWSVDIINK